MSAAPRLAWGRGGVQPSAPNAEPQSVPPPDESGSPKSPGHNDLVWFLADVVTCFTHWIGGTVPCLGNAGDECTHCLKQVKQQRAGFAPVLFKVGEQGRTSIWQPRTMRVPTPNIDGFGQNLRGRSYRVHVNRKGLGNRSETTFRFVRTKLPPVEAFDAGQVMQNIWFPRHASRVHVPTEVLVTDDTVLSPKEKSLDEQLAEMDSAKLTEYAARMKGFIPFYADKALEELARRGETPTADVLQFASTQSLDEANAVIEQISQEIEQGKASKHSSLQAPVRKPHHINAKEVGGHMIAAAYPLPVKPERKAGAA